MDVRMSGCLTRGGLGAKPPTIYYFYIRSPYAAKRNTGVLTPVTIRLTTIPDSATLHPGYNHPTLFPRLRQSRHEHLTHPPKTDRQPDHPAAVRLPNRSPAPSRRSAKPHTSGHNRTRGAACKRASLRRTTPSRTTAGQRAGNHPHISGIGIPGRADALHPVHGDRRNHSSGNRVVALDLVQYPCDARRVAG